MPRRSPTIAAHCSKVPRNQLRWRTLWRTSPTSVSFSVNPKSMTDLSDAEAALPQGRRLRQEGYHHREFMGESRDRLTRQERRPESLESRIDREVCRFHHLIEIERRIRLMDRCDRV